MAKTIYEWQLSFRAMFKEMCRDLDANPVSTSINIFVDDSITVRERSNDLRFKVKIKFE